VTAVVKWVVSECMDDSSLGVPRAEQN